MWRLLAAGHDVTLFNRGTHADPFGGRVERLRGDRTTDELGFVATPLTTSLASIVASFLAHPPADRPEAYATRAREIELACN